MLWTVQCLWALHISFYESSKFDMIVLRYIQWNRRMPKRHWITIWLPLNSVIVFHKTWFSICFVSFLSRYWFLGGDRIAQNCSTFCICLIEYTASAVCIVHSESVSQSLISCFLTLSPREFRIRLIQWNKHLFLNFTVFSLSPYSTYHILFLFRFISFSIITIIYMIESMRWRSVCLCASTVRICIHTKTSNKKR